jgi:hypothetical protein
MILQSSLTCQSLQLSFVHHANLVSQPSAPSSHEDRSALFRRSALTKEVSTPQSPQPSNSAARNGGATLYSGIGSFCIADSWSPTYPWPGTVSWRITSVRELVNDLFTTVVHLCAQRPACLPIYEPDSGRRGCKSVLVVQWCG